MITTTSITGYCMHDKFSEYLNGQLHNSAWAFFLGPFVQELLSHVSNEEMRNLARSAGIRAGRQMPLPACDSLQQMEAVANDHWSRLGWGIVTFQEYSGHLSIEHRFAPLRATLGEPAMAWAAGFLEGVYQEWFTMLGAGRDLLVRQEGGADSYGGLVYRLAR